MATLVNQSLLYSIGLLGTPIDDDNKSATVTTQAAAVPILGEAMRCTSSTANGSFVLKSVGSGDAAPLTFVVNDSPNTIKVFAAPGENMNGSLNGSLSIAAGACGIFIRVPNHISAGTADWRAAAIT